MSRLFCLASLLLMLAVVGCGSSDSTNIMESADQAAIDAYDAQVAADEAAMGNYEEAK
ncbi:hypothetical protein K227x_40370 [Rubripirellula lacrimiformis]|uniref:Secreted protein n=1 Tax=Rubripirellula lacrimiformis TaxID=1930273 RepID=A0A517NET6_9BACT|nr:hypothetical protein [Rubripirellula lacrimiformis]QDT05636.1 hypothetical protein K227x_40370 [Rubripirellula lacrimiformis]